MRDIVAALEESATLNWTVSQKLETATIDGSTFLGVLILNIETGKWITLAVSIVDGSADRIEWGQDPRLPIRAVEHWVRTEH